MLESGTRKMGAQILIESQWNLKFNDAGDIVARVSILIESQWNLK